MRRFFLPVQSEASAFALSDISEAALGPQARRSFEDCSQADFLAARQVLSVARWASFAVFQAALMAVRRAARSVGAPVPGTRCARR